MQIQVKLLNENCKPYRKYDNDAGFDLRANLEKPVMIAPGEHAKIGTGVCIEIPPGYYGDIRGRSGLTAKGVICPGGTVDSGYTGQIYVVLVNVGRMRYMVEPGERIAQLIIAPLPKVELVEVDELRGGERGDRGFGSTGRV